MLVIQLPLQFFQQTAVHFLARLVLFQLTRGDACPQLSLSPQCSTHLQGLGLLRLQLDLELLEAPVEAQAFLLGLLGEPRRGVALLLQGHSELSYVTSLIVQTELQVLEARKTRVLTAESRY